MTRRRHFLSAMAALGTALALPDSSAAAPDGYMVQPWPLDKSVPSLDVVDLAGEPWKLDRARGRVALLNFWATWCEPCVTEMPSLDAVARTHGGSISVVGINYTESVDGIKAFLAKTPVGFRILRDTRGAAFKAWTRGVLPTTIVIDRTGIPRLSVIGEMDWSSDKALQLLRPFMSAP